MKLLGRHDTMVAILGTGVLTAGYYWGVICPGRMAAQKIEDDIARAHDQMHNIPVILAERSHLQERVERQREQFDRLEAALPADSHVSSVLHEVASQAQRCGLTIVRLEPMPSIEFASYAAHPFHLSCRGTFVDVSQFLKGLETQTRLVTFGNVDFTRCNEGIDTDRGRRIVQANVDFNVYSRNSKTTKLAENTASR